MTPPNSKPTHFFGRPVLKTNHPGTHIQVASNKRDTLLGALRGVHPIPAGDRRSSSNSSPLDRATRGRNVALESTPEIPSWAQP